MREDIKAKWVQALRSGEYKQGQRKLREGDKFCCLGVLCDLHSKETGTQWKGDVYLCTYNVLPDELVDWAKIKSHNPRAGVGLLAEHNDGVDLPYKTISAKTFSEIADLIEQYM